MADPLTDTGARAELRQGKLEISIAIDALPVIVSGSCMSSTMDGLWRVTDPGLFAKEVCHALNNEREDGTTRVHLMFDAAFMHAIEQGAEGIEEVSEAEFEADAARFQGLPSVPGLATAPQPEIPRYDHKPSPHPASEGEEP